MRQLNVWLKIILAALLTHAVWFSDLPQYKNKAIALRVIFYPLAALLTWLVWRFGLRGSRRKKSQYPYMIDICLTFVVSFDLLGNTLAVYDKIWWWDDLMHFMLSVPWVMAAGYLLGGKSASRKALAAYMIAYGLTCHVVWEMFEYFSFVRSHPTESMSAYRDTIGDLCLSLAGTYMGAWLGARYLYKPKVSSKRR